jgi:hypothetical protein
VRSNHVDAGLPRAQNQSPRLNLIRHPGQNHHRYRTHRHYRIHRYGRIHYLALFHLRARSHFPSRNQRRLVLRAAANPASRDRLGRPCSRHVRLSPNRRQAERQDRQTHEQKFRQARCRLRLLRQSLLQNPKWNRSRLPC